MSTQVEDALRKVIEEDPVAKALWFNDPMFHAALDNVRAHERHGGDIVYALIRLLATVSQSAKVMRDREIERMLREPLPPRIL